MIENIPNKLVKLAHFLLLVVLIFGVFLPAKYLPYYLFLLPALHFHWLFNDNKCMLTELEYYFDKRYLNLNYHEEVRHYKYIDIFKTLKKFNIYFDSIDSFTTYLLNICIVCWIVGLIRLVSYQKKNIHYAWSIMKPSFVRRIISDRYK